MDIDCWNHINVFKKASSPTEPDTAVKKVVFADTVKPSPEDEKREAEEKALKNERVEGKEGAAAVESPSSAAEQHQDSSTNAHHQHPAGMTRLAIQMQEIFAGYIRELFETAKDWIPPKAMRFLEWISQIFSFLNPRCCNIFC